MTHETGVSGYGGYWSASCTCGWTGTAHRSTGPLNARPRATADARRHLAGPVPEPASPSVDFSADNACQHPACHPDEPCILDQLDPDQERF